MQHDREMGTKGQIIKLWKISGDSAALLSFLRVRRYEGWTENARWLKMVRFLSTNTNFKTQLIPSK